jgi:hypothetical protein
LPIAASRTVNLGGTVVTVGFPDIGLQGFAPKLSKGEIASLSGAGDDSRYFQINVPVQSGNSAPEAVLRIVEQRRKATPLRSHHYRVGAESFGVTVKRVSPKVFVPEGTVEP